MFKAVPSEKTQMSFRENVIASQAGFITGVCMLDVH